MNRRLAALVSVLLAALLGAVPAAAQTAKKVVRIHTAGPNDTNVETTMLAWLEATLRAAGIAMIRLEARARNTAALAFYRKHGFNQTGLLEGYYSDREDAVRLERDLRVAR